MINSSVMSKYLGIVIGIIAVFLGIRGLIAWYSDLGALLRGSLPLICVLGGAIAVIAGFSEINDEISSKREAKK